MTNVYVTSLNFDGFSLDVDVDMERSKEFTVRFNSPGSGFVFAVAEVWLNVYGNRSLLISSEMPANYIEILKLDLLAFSEPVHIEKLEQTISYGGWRSWMSGYWKRFNDDMNEPNDEEIYDQLIKLELMSSKNGCVAIYKYEGVPTIEATIFGSDGVDRVHCVSNFSEIEKSIDIAEKISLITDAINSYNRN